ncbi:MAG: hypothetical protein WDN26_24580 [Chitinophagaceae bacterium]
MRLFNKKFITHSSGKQLPLLCIDNDMGEIEYAIQAMPLLRSDGESMSIKVCLKNEVTSVIEEVEKYFFDLPLSFGRAIEGKGSKPVFITKGLVKLANLEKNETYGAVSYSGIRSRPYMHATLHERSNMHEFLVNECSALHLINRFSFTHPDDQKVEKEFECKMPLRDLFILSDINPQNVLRYYCYVPEEMRYRPYQIFQKTRDKGKINEDPAFVEQNGELKNFNNALFFNKATPAHTLINSDILSHNLATGNRIQNGLLLPQLAVIKLNDNPDLPLNEEIKQGLYKDRQKPAIAWYQDFITLVRPAAGTAFAASPFRFLFRVKGMDVQGKPVLESEITVTLACNLPAGTSDFTPDKLKRIPKQNLSVTMSIPFMDQNGNNKISDITSSAITQQADVITARFILNNEWTRVAYAAMSSRDVISNPVKLKVAYTFNVYTKVTPDKINFVSLHKLDRLPIVKTLPRGLKLSSSVFVASQNMLMTPAGLSIKYETAAVPNKINNAVLSHANVAAFVNTVPQNPNNTLANVKFRIDSLLYNNELELFLACNEYGEYYQEEKNGELTPVGCREPYKLGEVSIRLYTEISELRTAKYRVLRSNQVPNRFVIVPFRYIISRKDRDADTPFTPDLILYSTFDVNNPAESHSMLNAVLQPDIEHYTIVKLTKTLGRLTSYEPDILFINEIETTKTYQWSIPESLYISGNAMTIGSFINYSLVCRIENALTLINMLKSATQGINGTISYVLPDESSYTSSITINIHEVEGPWLDSPLLIKADAAKIEFENILDTTIDVAGIYADHEGSPVFDSLNISLAPKSKVTQPLPARSNIVPEYSVQPGSGSLEEVHSYSENIGCQLIFIETTEKDLSGFSNIRVLYSLANDTQYLQTDVAPDNIPLEVILPIPLTKYLNDRMVRYKMQAIKSDNSVIDTPWETADLSTGNIINLTTTINTYFI